jgi:large subunit ribosomal protein L11
MNKQKATKKKVIGIVKLQIKAQQATPAPPIGPAVGQYGINIMGFCKEFNAQTTEFTPGAPVPALITIYHDKTFSFVIKTLPTAYLLKQVMKKDANDKFYVTNEDIVNIVKLKRDALTADTDDAAVRTIMGTARSMHIQVED